MLKEMLKFQDENFEVWKGKKVNILKFGASLYYLFVQKICIWPLNFCQWKGGSSSGGRYF